MKRHEKDFEKRADYSAGRDEMRPAMYGPPPISKKISCMGILLFLGALIAGIIVWFIPKRSQPCVYGPPPIEEPCVYGPPPFEEQERDSDAYGSLLIEKPEPKLEPKPKPTLYGPKPIDKHNEEDIVPLY